MRDCLLVSSFSGGSCRRSGLGEVWCVVLMAPEADWVAAEGGGGGGGGCIDGSADMRPESVAEEAVRVASE